ncbi:hypothetical protein RND81_13G138800 [Saponaria officinalis]|uniref:GRF-type domain-containing protein n=1 Tax=Saponaria officinalis TaxID=3572 RepID=A0AAW1H348_SAPOF
MVLFGGLSDFMRKEPSSMSEPSFRSSFEGPKKCYCEIPVAVVKSWTSENSGRKFEACKFYNPQTNFRGCRFFRWSDRTQTDWQMEIINQLVYEKKMLKSEVKLVNQEVKWLREERAKLVSELQHVKRDDDEPLHQLRSRKTRCLDCSGIAVVLFVVLVGVIVMVGMLG